MKDPKKLEQDIYQSYMAIYKALEPILKQNKTDWIKVTLLNTDLSKLTTEIEEEQTFMNESQNMASIHIDTID